MNNFRKILPLFFLFLPVMLPAQSANDYEPLWLQYETVSPKFIQDADTILSRIERKAMSEVNDYQLFRVHYSRAILYHFGFSKWNVQDAVLYLDSVKSHRNAQLLEQPDAVAYGCLYDYLIGSFILMQRYRWGNSIGSSDLHQMAQWTKHDVQNAAVRYLQRCFGSLPHTLDLKVDDFTFMIDTAPQFRNLRPTMFDLLLQDRVLRQNFEPMSCISLIDRAISQHTMPADRTVLIDYEIERLKLINSRLMQTNRALTVKYDTCLYWRKLDDLERKYGPDEAIDYARGVALFQLRETEQTTDTFSCRSLKYFNRVRQNGHTPYYLHNAEYYIEQITAPFLKLKMHTREISHCDLPAIPVRCANLDTLHVSVYRIHKNQRPYLHYVREDDFSPYHLRSKEFNKLRECVEYKTFIFKNSIPNQRCDTILTLDSLPVGKYALLFHASPVCDTSSVLCFEIIHITDIHLTTITKESNAYLLVRNRITGEPLAHKPVITHNFFPRFTNANGELRFRSMLSSFHTIDVRNGKDHYDTWFDDYCYSYRYPHHFRYHYGHYDASPYIRIITDRTLYRPGQPLYYKLWLTKKNKVLANRTCMVIMGNYQTKVDTFFVETNEFGSAWGSFQVPDRTGLYDLSVFACNKQHQRRKGSAYGIEKVRVEEYRLPTFKVKLEKDTLPTGIRDTLHIFGAVLALNEQPLSNAAVHLQISDNLQGEVQTDITCDVSGRFTYAYPLSSNASSLSLTAKATATDLNGETHSDVQYYKVRQSPFSIHIKQMEDVDLSLTDSVKWVIMPRNNSDVLLSLPIHTCAERLESDSGHRQLIWETVRTYKPDSLLQVNVSQWPTGHYRLTAFGITPQNDTIQETQSFNIVRTASDTLTIQQPLWASFSQLPTQKGGEAMLTIASNMRNVTAICNIFQGNKHLKTICLPINRAQKRISFKTLEKDASTELSAVVSTVCNDSLYHLDLTKHFTIENPLTPKQQQRLEKALDKAFPYLTLNLTHWKRQIVPGSKEEWEVEISQPNSKTAPNAELLAWMVDCGIYELNGPKQNFEYPSYFNSSVLPSSLRKYAKPLAYSAPIECNAVPRIKNYPIYPPQSEHHILHNKNYEMVARLHTSTISGQNQEAKSVIVTYEPPVFDADNTASVRVSGEGLRTSPGRRVSEVDSQDGVLNSVRGNLSDAQVVVVDGMRTQDADPDNVFTTSIGQGNTQEATEVPAFKGFSSSIRMRNDFRETAFFLPELRTDEHGHVKFVFTMPDQYSRWKLNMVAHTQDFTTGTLQDYVISRQLLMLQTNAPRFFREGDTMVFRIKISNLQDTALRGHATVRFYDFNTGQPLAMLLNAADSLQSFLCKGKQNSSVSWRIAVPQGVEAVGYRVLAQAGNYGDGEERAVPVLPNRAMMTESMHFAVRSNTDTTFIFNRLKNNNSPTLSHYSFTVEANSDPMWSAVQSLPYLMQNRYDCNEQTFANLYANAIALHLLQQQPQLTKMFAQWRYSTATLLSPLYQNEQFQNIRLEETPWVAAAQCESAKRIELAQHFDPQEIEKQLKKSYDKLSRSQTIHGGWDWFGGRTYNQRITAHIVTGYRKLQHLGIEVPQARQMMEKAIRQMDSSEARAYRDAEKEKRTLTFTAEDAQYLYARTYGELDTQWLQQPYVQQLISLATRDIYRADFTRQAETALMLHRIGRTAEAQDIIKSLRQRATISSANGMYWEDKNAHRNGYDGLHSPIAQQAILIEAFNEISPNPQELSAMKQWLLAQKQSNCWSNTKATTEAVYALLLNADSNVLAPSATRIVVGSETLTDKVDAAQFSTGHIERVWTAPDIDAQLARIEVHTDSVHPLFGSCQWQYFEPLDKVQDAASGLHLERALFHRTADVKGVRLDSVTDSNPVRLGERVTVRIVISTDRALEYVHLKDLRASCFEPASSREGYGTQSGLQYFESPRDAATNFFITRMDKGTYVLEYELVATQTGDFSNGLATIACMYAPEYRAQSDGLRVRVTEEKR